MHHRVSIIRVRHQHSLLVRLCLVMTGSLYLFPTPGAGTRMLRLFIPLYLCPIMHGIFGSLILDPS